VAAYLIASNGQVLTWTFSDAKDQPIAPNKGTVILMTESSTMQESLNPKVAYVIARIAQRPGEIELAIDEPLTQEAKQKKK
jgi:hypothetical protein